MLTSPAIATPADAQSQKTPGTMADDSSVGSVAWTNPNNAKTSDNSYATVKLSGYLHQVSHYLKATNFGFSLPEGATVVGIVAGIEKSQVRETGFANIIDYSVRAIKGGTIAKLDRYSPDAWSTSDEVKSYGGSSDLWGLTWAATDINSSGFGVALAVQCASSGECLARVDAINITVYYTEAADENRICFATRSVELRTDGCFRQHSTEDVWGRLVPEGLLPYAPPSGMENRTLRVMVVPSQGDFAEQPDSGTNKIKLQVFYRPAYHYAREAGFLEGWSLMDSQDLGVKERSSLM